MLREEYNRIMEEIESLPSGGITYKRINGKEYAYYQWREEGKQRSRRVKDAEMESLLKGIDRRKQLRDLLQNVEIEKSKEIISEFSFKCVVRLGEELERFAKPVAGWKKRECYAQLRDYIYGDVCDRVYILYGLRRTGKTTLIRQLILNMTAGDREKTAFIQVQDDRRLSDLNHDLKYLESQGYRYVFIDEVTLLGDFIEGAALLSDVFAASGMKIVMAGTDSLGFIFAEDEELYGRCIMSHTTFIPYREFERVLDIKGIDNYIRYGGTMSPGGRDYNKEAVIFSTKKSTDEYVDSAIAKNIQHSLKNYEYEGHFRSLRELYKENELTNVINRIVEDINHRFTMEVLNRDFKSNDLRISAGNLRKDREKPNDILDHIDYTVVNGTLKVLLEIRNKEERTVEIQDVHRQEIKEYLDLLDLTAEVDVRWMADFNKKETRTIFTQPGMRFSQAEAVIKSLMQDNEFRGMSFNERKRVTERIVDEIKGRMMEDIILLETKMARKNCEVFTLQFAVGEFDMVVFDPEEGMCEIYEIKHSTEIVPQQCRHLLDEKKCRDTEFRYGRIAGKYVIYRGVSGEWMDVKADANGTLENVKYLNVEEYLKKL